MTDNSSNIQIKAKPKICAIDLDQEIIEALHSRGLDCFAGTLGSQIKVPNLRQDYEHRCLLNCVFPPNLHEYDIVVVDLKAREPIEYKESEHKRSLFKGSDETILVSRYPETLFDPRPLSASILQQELKDLFKKETLIIVFSAEQEVVEYHSLLISNNYHRYGGSKSFEHSLYDFLPCVQIVRKKFGRNTVVSDIDGRLNNFLCKYNDSFVYEATFKHPTEWVQNGRESVERNNFFPLLVNQDDEIVGFVDCLFYPAIVFVFPQIIQYKKEFILELIDEILPGLYPTIFPYSEQFSWLKSEKYFLPNQAELLSEKEKLKKEYTKALKKLDKKIEQNQAQHQFLHDLLSETGTPLVKTVEHFFYWLDFTDVTNMDETNPELKEEDLQVALENGLLVVEIKGIGGTSKDKECSQINKIKYRRAEERNSFDVYALYIVNHQRYLPPTDRRNPPFSAQQIADAKSEKRGLLTTYELYNLYSKIEQGFITKEDARAVLTKYGLVEFKPSNARLIGYPSETHHKGKIVILKIENVSIYQGAKIIVCNDETWIMAEILEIKVNDETVESVSDGEIGLKLSHSVLKTSELWLQTSKE